MLGERLAMYVTSLRCAARLPVRAGVGRGVSSASTVDLSQDNRRRWLTSRATTTPAADATVAAAAHPTRQIQRPRPRRQLLSRGCRCFSTSPSPSASSASTSRRASAPPLRVKPQEKENVDVGKPQEKENVDAGKLDHHPERIAVLGGGLTGLSTAWYLSAFLPKTKIDVYEASGRLGGWIETERTQVETPDGRVVNVHFEHAARMVTAQAGSIPRWDDLLFFHMVRRFLSRPLPQGTQCGDGSV